MAPKFSAYPFERLRRLTRQQARLESIVATWIAARSRGERLAKLVGGPVRVQVVASGGSAAVSTSGAAVAEPSAFDPFAARSEVRVGAAAIDVRASSLGVRRIAQRVLGGPDELAAARPLGVVEKSLWTLVVATALEDLGVFGDVWPQLDDVDDDEAHRGEMHRGQRGEMHRGQGGELVVELAVTLADIALAVQLRAPADFALRAPPSRTPAWFETTKLDIPIVLGRCALARAAVARLAVRNLVTLERPAGGNVAELQVAGGAVGLRAMPGALEGEVATGYVARDMSLPDDAHVELTVALGTTQLSLRQLGDLAIGQIVQLGRPLAGPFELRAAGRVVGRGELVDVDGELAVRIVSLGD